MSPPGAPPPPGGEGAGGQKDDLEGRGNYTASRTSHDVPTLGAVLRRRAKNPVDLTPIAYIGTPARMVAGEILSGEKPLWEIATELIDVLGPHTAILLAHEIAARVTAASQENTL